MGHLSHLGLFCHPWVTPAVRGPPEPSVGHLRPPWATSSHRGPPEPSVGHLRPPWATSSHRGPPEPSASIVCGCFLVLGGFRLLELILGPSIQVSPPLFFKSNTCSTYLINVNFYFTPRFLGKVTSKENGKSLL